MQVSLAEPFTTLWQGKDPFVEVERLAGRIYRALEGRRTLRTEVNGHGYFVKIHHGVGWRDIVKNWLTGKAPVLGAGNEWRALQRLHEAGVPKGVFNMVNGDGAGVGTRLAVHPDIDMISFTGSTRAGKLISQNAAGTLKRVVLELGGKGANLIFADADKDAVKRGVLHCFNNTGQSCNAPTRMLVERSIYDQAVAEAKKVAESVTVDSGHKPGKHIGPLVSEVQFNKVQGLIQKGIEEGARLVTGGPGRPEGLDKGYYVRPTVFADVNNQMTIAREEIFGPVLSIIPFDSEEEALAIANDTDYGLTNYVQSSDGARLNRLAVKLKAGMVEMNGQPRGAGAPFGGVKASGRAREGGVWGIEEFLEAKSISGWAAAA